MADVSICPLCAMTGLMHCGRRSQRAAKIAFSTRRGERVYSRKCAFHVLVISSASYTECALYPARANDGQTAGPSNYRECFTNDCRGSEILEIRRKFD
jgi:hypothetical protein